MESKICTYTEKNARLQLVRVYVESTSQWIIELRFNRSVVYRWTEDNSLEASLYFSHCVSLISVDRTTSFMSDLTQKTRDVRA